MLAFDLTSISSCFLRSMSQLVGRPSLVAKLSKGPGSLGTSWLVNPSAAWVRSVRAEGVLVRQGQGLLALGSTTVCTVKPIWAWGVLTGVTCEEFVKLGHQFRRVAAGLKVVQVQADGGEHGGLGARGGRLLPLTWEKRGQSRSERHHNTPVPDALPLLPW